MGEHVPINLLGSGVRKPDLIGWSKTGDDNGDVVDWLGRTRPLVNDIEKCFYHHARRGLANAQGYIEHAPNFSRTRPQVVGAPATT